jgi:DNA-binding MarR family transcriptional regulator
VSGKQKCLINLIYTFNYFDSDMKKNLQKFGLLYQHYNILKILKGAKGQPLTHKQLLSVMLDKTRDLTRLIDKLENMGYVVRKVNDNNKRSILINLTPEGLNKTLELERHMEAWVEKCSNITQEDCITLSDLLDKFRDPYSE